MRGPKASSILASVAAVAMLGATMPAAATPHEHAERRRATTRAAHPSQSVGLPFGGSLRNGVLLRESETVRYTGEYAPNGNFWGTEELVHVLERAAAQVARRVPGARLSVGELSARRGGALAGHRSHRNGRDADIAFYMVDAANHTFDPFGFANFDHNGHGLPPNESLRFDDARNWELVSRLVTDPDARVQYIFVANTLRTRLLATGRRRHASARALARAEQVMIQPTHGHPHRNHFHMRIYCPPADRPACEDREPFHAWYPGTPPRTSVPPADVGAVDGS